MRMMFLAIALLGISAPAAAQAIVCREQKTSIYVESQKGEVHGKVLACTHKPTGRVFYQPVGSPTPAKAPWETAAAPPPSAKPPSSPSAKPPASLPATPAGNFAALNDCKLALASVAPLFKAAKPLSKPPTRFVPPANPDETVRMFFNPAGLKAFGLPVETLGLVRIPRYDGDEDEYEDGVTYQVHLGIARTPSQVVSAIRTSTGVPSRPYLNSTAFWLAAGGTHAIRVFDDPAGTRVRCEWDR